MLLFVHSLKEYSLFVTPYIRNITLIFSSTTEANYNIEARSSISNDINQC
jgi:hypothetical protein